MESPAVSNDDKKLTLPVCVNKKRTPLLTLTRKKLRALVSICFSIGVLCAIIFVGLKPKDQEWNNDLNLGCSAEGVSLANRAVDCICWTKDMWTCTLPDNENNNNNNESSTLLTMGLPSYNDCTLVTFDATTEFEDSEWACDGNTMLVSPLVDSNTIQTWYWPSHDDVQVGTSCLRREELDEDVCREPIRVQPLGSKTAWPELEGKTGNEAKGTILAEFPDLNVYIVHTDWMVTMDWRTDRVRVFVNDRGKVVRTPTIG